MAIKKKTNTKKSARKYSPRASQKVAEEMRELKQGKLRSGRSKKKVTSTKQAIAIGLSEARREGARVPPPPSKLGAGAKKAAKASNMSGSRKKASKTKTSRNAAR